jgi:hypothetical protein
LSHVITIRTEVRDPAAVRAACRRLGLPEPVHGTAKLFSGEATGLLVKLPGRHPRRDGPGPVRQLWRCVGRQEHLDRFLQRHALEKAYIEARKRGHSVVEQALADGSIKLTITVGGGS